MEYNLNNVHGVKPRKVEHSIQYESCPQRILHQYLSPQLTIMYAIVDGISDKSLWARFVWLLC